MQKFCIDCKHYIPPSNSYVIVTGRCKNPNLGLNIETGLQKVIPVAIARTSKYCNNAGIWFEVYIPEKPKIKELSFWRKLFSWKKES